MPWNFIVFCVTFKSCNRTGKLHMKRRFGELMGQIYPSGLWLSITRSLRKIKRSSISLVKRSSEAFSLAMRCTWREFEKEVIEELKNLDALEIHARRHNAKEVLMRKKGEYFSCFYVQLERVSWQEKFKKSKRSSLF